MSLLTQIHCTLQYSGQCRGLGGGDIDRSKSVVGKGGRMREEGEEKRPIKAPPKAQEIKPIVRQPPFLLPLVYSTTSLGYQKAMPD